MKHCKKGFTLIEIAIVLIIVALLSGGIIKGLELLEDSRKQKATKQIQSLSTAWFNYINRHQQLPGDDNLAQTHFGSDATNGDGDGILSDDELHLVWEHLHLAQIITGSKSNAALNPWGQKYSISYNADLSTHQLCMSLVKGTNASYIDNSLDDGKPSSGRVFVDSDISLSTYQSDGVYKLCSQL